MSKPGRLPLVPEQRADKNGRVVTRHVRQQGLQAASSVPQPMIQTSLPGKFKPTKKQTQNQFFALGGTTYSPDDDLMTVLGDDYDGYIRFTANDLIFYDVLSVTSADNAVTLLGAGIKDAAQAQEFLHTKGLSHLIKDHSWETDELLRRKVPPIYYAEMCAKGMESNAPELNVDAAEAHSVKALRDWQFRPATVPERVREGVVRLEDVKTVGATRLVKFDPEGTVAVAALADMASGKLSFDAAGMRLLIDCFNDKSVTETGPGNIMSLAREFDAEFVVGLYHHDYALRLTKHVKRDKQDGNNLRELVAYGDAMCRYQRDQGYKVGAVYSSVVELWRAGVDHRDAVEGLYDEQSATQIIGIHQEGIAPSVSGGWL